MKLAEAKIIFHLSANVVINNKSIMSRDGKIGGRERKRERHPNELVVVGHAGKDDEDGVFGYHKHETN